MPQQKTGKPQVCEKVIFKTKLDLVYYFLKLDIKSTYAAKKLD